MTETIVIDSDDGSNGASGSELVEAYGFHLAPCQVSSAPPRHRSCKKPNCLNRIFSAKHADDQGGIWTPPIAQVSALRSKLKDVTPRSPLSLPVGLHNMGATCYINSLLQMLYANNRFRNAILSTTWSSLIMKQMQRLFARMSLTISPTITPTEFVDSLNINNEVHQDLHEFNKLLLQHIQATASPLTLVEDEYHGQLSFITQCSICHSLSKRSESFADLQLNLSESLEKSFEELIAPELLKDDNTYFCDVCKKKQIAQRRLQLDRLPPTINLHLLRFIFEKETFRKAKSLAKIRISQSIDMSRYIAGHSAGPVMYDLIAVLRHQGASVDSGHFMVDILGKDKTWYRFNDHNVKKVVDGLALEESINSSNAYMLVYTERRLETAENAADCTVDKLNDSALGKEILKENLAIKAEYCRITEELEALEKLIEQRKCEVRSVYSSDNSVSPLNSDTEFDESATVLPLDWLRAWTHNVFNSPLDCSPILCPHGCLNPVQSFKMTRISNSAWSIIKKSLTSPIVVPPSNRLCQQCVEYGKHLDSLRSLLQRMQRDLNADPNATWISSRYLRALTQAVKSSSQLPPLDGIQEGVLCPHGGLSLSKSSRSLIEVEALDILKLLLKEDFDKMFSPIDRNTAVCLICQEDRDRDREERAANSNARKNERSLLKDTIRLGDNRPDSGCYYIVPSDWFSNWNDFTRITSGKSMATSPGPIPTSSLLCKDHGFLVHSLSWPDPDALYDDAISPLRLVVSEEYALLKARYGVSGPDIKVEITDRSSTTTAEGIQCSHAMCASCFQSNQLQTLRYTQETIRVVQEQDAEKTLRRKRKRRDRSSAVELQVNSSDSIGTVKLRLWELLDVHPSRQTLVDLKFKPLLDSSTLEQCGVPRNSTLILRVSEKGEKDDDDDVAVDMGAVIDLRAGFAGSALDSLL